MDCTAVLMHYKCVPFDFVDDGYLKTFFTKTASMTPEERADYLGKDEVQ